MSCLSLVNKTGDQKSSPGFYSGSCCRHRPECESSPWFHSDLPPARAVVPSDSCSWQQPTGSASWGLSHCLHKHWDQSKNEGSMGLSFRKALSYSLLIYSPLSACPLSACLKDLLPRNSRSLLSSGLVSRAGACKLSEVSLQCTCSSIQRSSLSGQFSFESKETAVEGSREWTSPFAHVRKQVPWLPSPSGTPDCSLGCRSFWKYSMFLFPNNKAHIYMLNSC